MIASLINTDPGFRPHVEGTRIDVQQIAEHHVHFGWPAEKIAESFRLTLAQVHAALTYYYQHRDEIEQSIAEDREKIKEIDSLYGVPDNVLLLVMTPQEIAQHYPISVDAVYQAIRHQRLTARQSGKTWLVLRRDAERLWGHKRRAG